MPRGYPTRLDYRPAFLRLRPPLSLRLNSASSPFRAAVSISIDEFAKADIRVGKVLSVEDIPAARKPMYKLQIDFGGTTMQCVGGIKAYYSKEELQGKVVVAVVNLVPKQVAGVESQCMLLAAYDETSVSLLSPDKGIAAGTKVG